ncbi:sulfotransferase [Paraburkholderia sp. IW21]|uniref:sulfotransferase family protein n=1 Tax=Paraburkholderia sp. IW21 TaxID=3242488 RepID=UPI003520F72B
MSAYYGSHAPPRFHGGRAAPNAIDHEAIALDPRNADLPELLTADVLADRRGLGDPSAAPIFIVGMPRSGSTLIEQILASHPQVFGAGERMEFGAALVSCISRDRDDPLRIDIEALKGVGAAQLQALGADYLRRMHAVLPDMPAGTPRCTRFTDKYFSRRAVQLRSR